MPRQLEESQISGHFRQRNGQRDTKEGVRELGQCEVKVFELRRGKRSRVSACGSGGGGGGVKAVGKLKERQRQMMRQKGRKLNMSDSCFITLPNSPL